MIITFYFSNIIFKFPSVESYLCAAKNLYGYNIEQALAMLFWHKHNFKKAMNDMKCFVQEPDDWTFEDRIIFEQALLFNGKNFNKINSVVSDVIYFSYKSFF